MPWSETSTMDQRTQFIADYLREVLSVTELCDLLLWLNESVHLNGISYPTKRGVHEQKEAELFSRV